MPGEIRERVVKHLVDFFKPVEKKKMSIRKKNQQLESIIGYTPPKLYTGKNGKDWYIGFYATINVILLIEIFG